MFKKWLYEGTDKKTDIQPGLNKTGILCILDTRQIDPNKTANIKKNDKTSRAEGPSCIK